MVDRSAWRRSTAGRARLARRLVLLAATACVFAAAAPEALAANCTTCEWFGGDPGGNWSDGNNWFGSNPPSASVTSLTFPFFGSNCGSRCSTNNDIAGGVSAGTVSVDLTSNFNLEGNTLTIGSGGLQATATNCSASTRIASFVGLAIVASGTQTWSVPGCSQGFVQLGLGGPVTGSSALEVDLSASSFLRVSNDVNVGDLTLSGTGRQNVIFFAKPATSLNGASGNSVAFAYLQAVFDAPVTTGPISATSAIVQTGTTGESPVPDLTVDGTAAFDQDSKYVTVINKAGTTPGTDYSQLNATGDVSLGGAVLNLEGQDPTTNNCPTLHVGDVATLIKTTGSLTGTFNLTPDGSTMQMLCSRGTAPTFRINYTANSVTATVVSDTTTAMTANPSAAATNQPVALTATVTAAYGSGTPSGTVEFDNAGTPISGCASVPVDDFGAATCQASFPASSSPESLTASYTPASTSGYTGSSTASPIPVTVGRTSSSTTVSSSSSSPSAGQTVTYTATVTPAQSGPTEPSGTIQFADAGSAIGACSSQPLTQGSSASTATCTTSYDSPGSHSITASYGGDSNFTGSSSPAQPVTVSATGAPSPVNTPAPPAPSAHVSSPVGGARYTRGELVRARYSCLEGAGGPGIASCTGPVANGRPIDTSTVGHHSFTVTATSQDGQTSTSTASYTVRLANNHFTVSHLQVHRDGIVTLLIKVPGRGTIDVLETASKRSLACVAARQGPAPGRCVFARARRIAHRAGTLKLRVIPTTRGKRLLRLHSYRVTLRLSVGYTPAGGKERTQGFDGLLLRR